MIGNLFRIIGKDVAKKYLKPGRAAGGMTTARALTAAAKSRNSLNRGTPMRPVPKKKTPMKP